MVVSIGASGVATRPEREARASTSTRLPGSDATRSVGGDDGGRGGERRHDDGDVAGDAQRRVARGEIAVPAPGGDLDLDVAERREPRLRQAAADATG